MSVYHKTVILSTFSDHKQVTKDKLIGYEADELNLLLIHQ